MKFAPTPNGVLAPIRGQQNKAPAAFNALIHAPHAKDFMPGRSKHKHPKVADLNQDLANLSDGSKSNQRLFAVWTEPNERTKFCGMIGISIWAADGEDSAFCLGNCATVQTADGQMGEDRRKEILEWLAMTNCLSEDNRVNAGKTAMERYIDDHNQKIQDADVIRRREEAAVMGEKMFTENFPNTPMRADSPRTQWKQKPEVAPEPAEVDTEAVQAEWEGDATHVSDAAPEAVESNDTPDAHETPSEPKAPSKRSRNRKGRK